MLGFVEITQGNFDLFNFPYFTGGGEKFRVRLQYGLERQDVEVSFKEPWFLEQRLALGYDLFYHNATYLSDYYDRVELRRFGQPGTGLWAILERIDHVYVAGFRASTTSRTALRPRFWQEGGWRSGQFHHARGCRFDNRDSVLLSRHGVHADCLR